MGGIEPPGSRSAALLGLRRDPERLEEPRAIALRRHGRVERWSELALPCAAGLALTALEIAVIDLLRTALTQSLNLPF